ncbi:MAG TPA: dihydropteroate synthase [Alphaproteobacteria bacterium]|jgi:dihydropteroate synthase|nr:MAG: Dihydropteroate synthase [Alphaproteobacteria bacterium MarineAlpha9_Bin6]PPR38686.1 MAG: Dihydropteroate synthase [Alphaproteobacteria bacterium MarineAlpha9_Bin5]HIA21704.1 dihydropteroate synthase [Alphaproteobacteria bacterium]HIB18958.1 dihydropteroate synthase [Alphaproteobacteria bacterium]HIC70800.1 dihydropteroate synthase [Alphaproteobacteria bacterium]
MGVTRPNKDPLSLDSGGHLYVRPLGIVHGQAAKVAINAGRGLPLAGLAAFTSCQVITRYKEVVQADEVTVEEFVRWQRETGLESDSKLQQLLVRLGRARAAIAGASFFKPVITGIVNVTPDSFSDGGEYATADQAIAHGRGLFRAGAGFIDVGGESTRPGAECVSAEVEQKRVIPVIRALAAEGIPTSIDTYHPETMLAAAANGASIINDVSALTHCVNSANVAAATDTTVILVHSQNSNVAEHGSMYGRVAIDIYDYLAQRISAACASGISCNRIVVDPGLGFAKTSNNNFQVLDWLGLYHGLGCPIMVGASRKFGRLAPGASPRTRLAGSVATALHAVDQGVQLIRVHDVAETAQALGVWRAIRETASQSVI